MTMEKSRKEPHEAQKKKSISSGSIVLFELLAPPPGGSNVFLCMLRWFLLILAFTALALGSLTIVKAPDWSVWQLAVLAGEFGHWLAILTFFLGLVAWWLRGDHGTFAGVTLALFGIATALLLNPAFQAWRLASALPVRLAGQFREARRRVRRQAP